MFLIVGIVGNFVVVTGQCSCQRPFHAGVPQCGATPKPQNLTAKWLCQGFQMAIDWVRASEDADNCWNVLLKSN